MTLITKKNVHTGLTRMEEKLRDGVRTQGRVHDTTGRERETDRSCDRETVSRKQSEIKRERQQEKEIDRQWRGERGKAE